MVVEIILTKDDLELLIKDKCVTCAMEESIRTPLVSSGIQSIKLMVDDGPNQKDDI